MRKRIFLGAPHFLHVATYLITFSCYGHRLPGQPNLVEAPQNHFGERLPETRPSLAHDNRFRHKQAPFTLDCVDRDAVLRAIVNVCRYKNWGLLAAHVRTTHVHVIVAAEVAPELAMNAFKAYATRAMNQVRPGTRDRMRWTRHGSTRYLWTRDSVEDAVRYVLEKQGADGLVCGCGEGGLRYVPPPLRSGLCAGR